jgi:hypothetical protein
MDLDFCFENEKEILISANPLLTFCLFSLLQILKPAEKKQRYVYGGMGAGRPVTPPRKQKKK